jgi:CHAD domain-containing protein
MRVATRRMRAAFDIFGRFFDPKVTNPFLQALRTLGRTLGEVRDLDVSLEKMHTYLQRLSSEQKTGLDALLDQWTALLEHARLELINHLNSQDYADFKSSFSIFLQTPGMGIAKTKKSSPTQISVRYKSPTLIYTRLASVMAFDSILNTASFAQLHALRIEFKIFRYTLEFFKEVLGVEAQGIINEIKTLQDHLGELNDANVACQNITRFLKKWDKRQSELPIAERLSPEPIVSYLAYRYAERHQLMRSFPELWYHFNRPELRQSLANAVAVL